MAVRIILLVLLTINSHLAHSSVFIDEQSIGSDNKYKQNLQNAHNLVISNPDSAEQVLNQYKDYYISTNDIELKASYYSSIALIELLKSKATVALPNYLEALNYYEKINDSVNISNQLSGIGACYMFTAQYLQAKRYLTKALHYAERVNDSTTISNTSINLSFIHFDNNEYGVAAEYLKKANSFAKSDFQRGRATNNLGEIFIKNNQLDSAINTFRRALFYSNRTNDQLMISMILSNIGYVKMMQNDTDSASFYFNLVLKRNRTNVEDYVLANTYSHFAKLEMNKKNFEKAKDYIHKSTQIAQQNQMSKVIADNNIWLSKYYSSLNNYKKAYEYELLGRAIKDSLFNEAKSKQISELEAIYQSEAKQAKINLLDAQNTANQLRLRNSTLTITALSIVIVLVALFSILLIRQNRLKTAMESQKLEHKLLRTQMNPHFIFNSLVAIQSLLNKQPPEVVSGYIGKFSRLMRLILENSRHNLISIETEVETLELYLEMQKIRFSDNFSYSIILPDDSDFLENMIPPMLAQPFVENAIEHGFLRSERGGVLVIRFYECTSYICCEIEDNGVGISKSTEDKKNIEHKSLAMKITNERLALLSKREKQEASLSIEDLSLVGKTGTLVKIKVPLQIKI